MNALATQKRTIAITGASGLIGRHLCDHFRREGWDVNALVRDVSKYPFCEEGIGIYKCDLPGLIDFRALETVDTVVHAAYLTRYSNLEEARQVNEEGTMRIYEASRGADVRKFVFVSSMAARPNAPSYYAQSKYRLESMMDLANDLVIRPGLVLANDGGLFSRILDQVKKLPVIPAFGGGQQIIRTVHINDLCKVFVWAISINMSGVLPVAEAEGIQMKELYRVMLRHLGQHKPVLSLPGRPFILLLQFLELLKVKLPVSSESLRGLLNRDTSEPVSDGALKGSGITIRSADESISSLIP